MASIQQRAGSFRFIFRYLGRQRFVTLGRVSRQEAEAKAAQADYLLLRLKQGLIALPEGDDIVDFLLRDGRPGQQMLPTREAITLAGLRDRYFATRGEALEPRTVDTARLHFKHLCGLLGDAYPIRGLTLADLQGYVDRRGRQVTRAGTASRPSPSARRSSRSARPGTGPSGWASSQAATPTPA